MIQIRWLKLLVTQVLSPTPLMDHSAPQSENSDSLGSNFRVAAAFGHHKFTQISGKLEMLQIFRVHSSKVKEVKNKREPMSMPEHTGS